MAIKVTIVRHGQTSKNECALIQTGMYEELTEKGIKQGKHLGKYLKNNCKEFTKVFTSDMTRAIQTGQAITSQWEDPNFKINPTAQLRERNYGEWDGRPIKDLINLAKELGVHPVRVTAPGGETFDEAFQRFLNFLKSLMDEHKEEDEQLSPIKHFLIVMHSAIIHGFLHKLLEQEDYHVENLNAEKALAPPPNTGFTTFTMSKGSCNVGDKKLCFTFEKILCVDHFTDDCKTELLTH